MLARICAPTHLRSVGIACIALDDLTARVAVARVDGSLELWVCDSRSRGGMDLVGCTTAFRKVTPRSVFFVNPEGSTLNSKEEKGGIRLQSSLATRIVVVTLGGQFLVYHAHNLELLDVITGVGTGYFSAVLSSNHSLVALAAGDGTCHLHQVGTALDFPFVSRGTKSVKASASLSVCFSPDGTFVFLGDDAGVVQCFDTRKMITAGGASPVPPTFHCELHPSVGGTHQAKRRRELKGSPVWALVHTKTVPHVLAATESGCLFVLHSTLGQQLSCFTLSTAPLTCLCVLGLHDHVLVGGTARDLISLQPSSRNAWVIGARTRRIHSNDITSLVSGTNITLVSAGLDGDLVLSSRVEHVRELFSVNIKNISARHRNSTGGCVHPAEKYTVAQWCSNSHILCVLARGALHLWALENVNFQKVANIEINGMRGLVRCSTIAPNGRYAAYATDARLTVLQLDGPSVYKLNISYHEIVNRDVVVADSFTQIRTMCFTHVDHVGWVLFTGSTDGVVRAVAMETGNTDEVLRVPHPGSIIRLVACTLRNHLAILSSMGDVIIWNVVEWAKVVSHCGRVGREGIRQAAAGVESGDAEAAAVAAFQREYGGHSIVDLCFCSTSFKKQTMSTSVAGSSPVLELALLRRDGHISVVDYAGDCVQTIWDSTSNVQQPYPVDGFGAVAFIPLRDRRAFAIQGHRHVAMISAEQMYPEGAVEHMASHNLILNGNPKHTTRHSKSVSASNQPGSFALAHLNMSNDDDFDRQHTAVPFWNLKRVVCLMDGALLGVDALAISPRPTDALVGMTVYNAKRFGT